MIQGICLIFHAYVFLGGTCLIMRSGSWIIRIRWRMDRNNLDILLMDGYGSRDRWSDNLLIMNCIKFGKEAHHGFHDHI